MIHLMFAGIGVPEDEAEVSGGGALSISLRLDGQNGPPGIGRVGTSYFVAISKVANSGDAFAISLSAFGLEVSSVCVLLPATQIWPR